MKLTLYIWRQSKGASDGRMVQYPLDDVSEHMSFLEMLDVLNEQLEAKGEEPVCFEHDCREGICGSCGLMINGVAHGPEGATTTCQLHMRHFKDGDEIYIEPWRAAAFPVIKDLVVDRSGLDRIIQAHGYVSVSTGGAPDANMIPISKPDSDSAMDAAQCIQCGACVAACKNASAMLFLSAKLAHLSHLPQGQTERYSRAVDMVEAANEEGFGSCTNQSECEAVCPKEISIETITRMNRDYLWAKMIGA